MWLVNKSNIRLAQNMRKLSRMRACNYFKVLKILGTLYRDKAENDEGKREKSLDVGQKIKKSSIADDRYADATYAFVDALVIIEVPSLAVS